MNTLAILRGTFGNFRPLSLTSSTYVIETYTITWNARYRQLVNTIMLMNTLAILRGTFGNFRPLSLTTSTCVNLHRDLYHYLECALSPPCEHYNVNEHPRNPSGYLRPLSLTYSTCVNLHRDLYHYLERALSPTCEHYNVNEHPRFRGTFGYLRPLSLTTSACVNLHYVKLTTDFFEGALL